MPGDPVQPAACAWTPSGSFSGFYCVWRGGLGREGPSAARKIRFPGRSARATGSVTTKWKIRRFAILKNSGSSITIGDGRIHVDGETIMTVRSAKSGTFQGITYPDYPLPSAKQPGGHDEERRMTVNKVAIVTGASEETERHAAGPRGGGVFRGIHYRTGKETGGSAFEGTPRSFLLRADLGDLGEIDGMVEEIRKTAGRADVLVNNAGMSVNRDIHTMKPEEFDASAS